MSQTLQSAAPETPAVLGLSRVALILLRIYNLICGVTLVAFLVGTFTFTPFFTELFTKRVASIDPRWLLPTLRLWIVLALPMVAAMHVLLSRLLDIVGTVRAGDPFTPVNAQRLKTVAWCLLAIEAIATTFKPLAGVMNAAGSHIDFGRPNFMGWLVVLLFFVLARVFEEGARLRTDSQAMI